MTTEQPILRGSSVPDSIRYFVRELIKRADDDLELGGFAIALSMTADRAEAELAKCAEERDLAVAHDRQPYPTAHAYEAVCKALRAQRQRADQAEAYIKELKAMNDTLERALGIPDEPPDDDEWVSV